MSSNIKERYLNYISTNFVTRFVSKGHIMERFLDLIHVKDTAAMTLKLEMNLKRNRWGREQKYLD
jgi:hypothetical protein